MRIPVGSIVKRKVSIPYYDPEEGDIGEKSCFLWCLVLDNRVEYGKNKKALHLDPLFFEDFPEPSARVKLYKGKEEHLEKFKLYPHNYASRKDIVEVQ